MRVREGIADRVEVKPGITVAGASASLPVIRALVAYFGPDLEDSVVRRRVAQWRAAGFKVRPFAFSRHPRLRRDPGEFINLGRVMPLSRASRIIPLALAVLRLLRERKSLAGIDLFIARNLDIAILALLARRMVGSSAPLIYEVLDINSSCTAPGWRGALFRRIEKWVLARIDLLVVSSPYFATEYYELLLGYRRSWFLFENKVPKNGAPVRACPPPSQDSASSKRPWRLGWFGYLDDERSWRILSAVARQLPDDIVIYVRGTPYTNFDMRQFLADVRELPNVIYGGPYRNPEDLAEVYAAVDIVWSTDCNFPTANSKWLLTNSLYEAGYFGKPVLGLAGTAVGHFLSDRGTGWCLREPMERALVDFIRSLDAETYENMRKHIARTDLDVFVETDEVEQVWTAVRSRPRVVAPPVSDEDAADHLRRARAKVLFIGLFPPPVNGQRIITQRMFERFDRLAVVARHDVDQFRQFGKLSKLLSAIVGCLKVLYERSRGCSTLYLAPHSGAGLAYSCVIALTSRLAGYRLAVHYHSYRNMGRHSWLMAAFLAICGPRAMHIVLAPPMADDLRRFYRSVENVAVLSNTVFIAAQPARRPDTHPRLRIGHLSNLSMEKGIATVLDCLRALCARGVDVELWLGGPAEDRHVANMISAAQADFGDRLKYFGPIASPNVAGFYGDIDLFLFPTLYEHEAEPLVVVDAIASGVPVIAADRGCIGYLLEGSGGGVFPMASFVDNAVQLIADWAADRAKLADASRNSSQRFIEMHTRSLRDLEELLAAFLGREMALARASPS